MPLSAKASSAGITEAARDRLRLGRRLAGAAAGIAARLHGDRRQEPCPQGVTAGRERAERALGGGDDPRRGGRVVGVGPDRGHVEIADDPRGELGVAELFRRLDGGQALAHGRRQAASAGERETARERGG